MQLLTPYKPLFYEPPLTRYFFVTGGRGSAKSYHVSTLLVNLSYMPNEVILFTRWTMISAHISIIPEFIEKINELNRQDDFIINKTEIENKHTGSRILFRGIKTSQGTQTANLKSIHGVTAFVLDEGEEMHDEDVFDRINLSVRSKLRPNRVIIVMNPSTRDHMLWHKFMEPKRDDTTYIHTTYLDNIRNLSDSFIEEANETKAKNLARYEHLFLGEWIDSAEGLLWNREMIDKDRIDPKDFDASILRRVVVAIDPAVSKTAKSDETGIIVIGTDANNQLYVIEDGSGVYSPNQWAEIARELAQDADADAYVAEINQGGDLVETNIRSVDSKRRVKKVRATKGKFVRAEPVYNLYEQGKVHHVGRFSKLEAQMVSWNPTESINSPDRVDALVWGATDLLLSDSGPTTGHTMKPARHKARRL